MDDAESLEDIQDEMEIIKRNTKKLFEMIDDASKYAKLDSIDKSEFEMADLSGIITDIVDSLKDSANEKSIIVNNKIKGKYQCFVNPFIKDVFFNLLSNAIKYSPENSKVTLEIEDARPDWRIIVKDNGIGIPNKHKENIFLRFKRVSKEGVRGAGLGLAIVERIMEFHNGRVWVEDNPEGGSIFYIELPKKRGSDNHG
jgi:signal transduction histidine kinase